MPRVLISSSSGPRSLEFEGDIVLGREPTCELPIDDALVSRRHACIRRTGPDAWVVEDLGSTHGTYLERRRISCAALSKGSEIQVGRTLIRVESLESSNAVAAGRVEFSEASRTATVQTRITVDLQQDFRPESEVGEIQALRKNYEKLRATYELTRAIGVEHDLERVLERIVDAVFQLIHVDRGAIVLFEPGTSEVRRTVARTRHRSSSEVVVSRTILQEVYFTREAVVLEDAVLDARFGRAQSIYSGGVRSAMCVPILWQREVVGVMHFDTEQARAAFGKEDLELLTTVAGQAALVIKNALLHARVEEVMAEDRRRLERVIHGLPVGVMLVDGGKKIVLANPEAERILPCLVTTRSDGVVESVAGRSLDELLEGSRDASLDTTIAGPPARTFTFSAARPGGDETVLLLHEITERKEQEQRTARAERLALVGQITGGIAHDFNNLLSVILSYARFLTDAITDPERLEEVNAIQEAGRRAAALIRQLLAYSRREVVSPRVVRLDQVVLGMNMLLERTLGEAITVCIQSADDLWWVNVDPGQVERVLLNLTVNARDAMPRGGTVSVGLSNLTLDAPRSGHGEPIPAGRYVVVRVSDTGCGMSPEVRGRLFEPFFTTKPVGAGTGLGLASVFGIVKQAGGWIAVESTPDVGSTFEIFLPAVDAAAPARPAPSMSLIPSTTGRERVLVVEDEEAVLGAAKRILTTAGYEVREAHNGTEALSMAIDDVDILVTDVVMPGLSGTELARRLRERRADLPVLYVTGYPDAEALRTGTLEQGARLLHKPFTSEQLLEEVRAVLALAARARRAA